MNEVTIPIKLIGLGEIKAELKQVKSDLVNATDPAEIDRLATRAGELNQQLKDTNKTIKNFSTGSTIQQVGNQISGIKDSLMNMDFSKASKQVTALTGTLANFKPADLAKGLGTLTKAVGMLSAQMIKMGISLLTNPIFLLVVVIVAIVAAVVIFLDKIGVLKIIMDTLMIPIQAVIDAFFALTDAIGLTSHAADENAEAVTKAMDKKIEASKKYSEEITDLYDHEIAKAKAAGEETGEAEHYKTINLQYQSELRQKDLETKIAAMAHMRGEDAEKQRAEIIAAINEEKILQREAMQEREVAHIANVKKVEDNAKKVADNARAVGKAISEKRKQYEQDRLNVERQIEDLRIAAIKNDAEREAEVLKEKYDRLRADLLKDAKKTDAEKKTLKASFDLAEQLEEQKIIDAKKKKQIEALNELNALKIANMVEGEAKIAAQQNIAYQAAVNAAKEKYGADSVQFAEFQEQLRIADAAATKSRSDEKIANQVTLLKSLNDLQLTDNQKKIAAIEAQYLKEQELANGNAETLLALENKHKKDLEDVAIAAGNADVAEAQKVRDAKLSLAMDITKGVTDIGGMLIKDQEKLAKFNKASALVQIGIDTAKAISALVAASNTNPLNGVTAGTAGIAQFASGIIQIATNIAKAKQLLTAPATPVPTTGGGDTGGGGGTNTATMIPQAAQLFGQGNNSNTVSAGGSSTEGGNMMVTAVVSETQITNVQKKINMINKNAEL